MSYGKKHDFQTFDASTSRGAEYSFTCYSQSTSYGFKHECRVTYVGGTGESNAIVAKMCYYNRTWETFKYETVLRGAIAKCPAKDREELTRQIIEKSPQNARGEVDREYAEFKQEYDRLTPRGKEALKSITLKSWEDVKKLTNIMRSFNVLNAMTSNNK